MNRKPDPIPITAAMVDPHLFGRNFQGETWDPWRTFLRALFGLPIPTADLPLFRACTGLADPLTAPASEATLVIGRRGGKSRTLALIAVYLSTIYRDWRPYLAPGEHGFVSVVAVDRRQAAEILSYIRAMLEAPMLRRLVRRDQAETIELTNHVVIEVHTASWRSIRGRTIIACLADELAFWRSEDSTNPDREILQAVRPALGTVPGAMLLMSSSPYARSGALWDNYRRYYAQPGQHLVWRAATKTMNPGFPQATIDAAERADPASAAAEYGAEFRRDLEAFVSREVVESCTVPNRHELPFVTGTRYAAFVDPSGGSSDSMTLAICHRSKDLVIVDAVRERRAPFSPEAVVSEFCDLLDQYHVRSVTGDRYGGEWCREPFKKQGVTYQLSEHTKSDLYRDSLPLLNSGRVELLDLPRLAAQLIGLERRTSRGGRDSIDHAPGGRDDVANAVCGCIMLASGKKAPIVSSEKALRWARIPGRFHGHHANRI